MSLLRCLLLLCCLGLLRGKEPRGPLGSHSLRYLFSFLSEPLPGAAQYSVVGYVDDVPIIGFTSESRRAGPRAPWMEKVTDEEPQYWDERTVTFQEVEMKLSNSLRDLMEQKKQPPDAHVPEVCNRSQSNQDLVTSGHQESWLNKFKVPNTKPGGDAEDIANEEESQSQAPVEHQTSGVEHSLSSSDDEGPGTSGVSRHAAPAVPSSSAHPAPTTPRSGNRHTTHADTDRPRTQDSTSTGTQATREATDTNNQTDSQVGPGSSVRATAGPAHVARGGGSGGRQRSRLAEGSGLHDDPQLVRIIDAYQDSTGGFGQVVGILKDIQQEQAAHHARMESKWDELTAVHRDILTCLRQISTNMSTPPCVPTTSVAARSENATGREDDSGGESSAPQMPAPEDPPRKKTRGRPKKDK